MRSELNELALIDSYLFHQLDQQQTQSVETSILLNEDFAEKVEAQRTAHRLIRLYGRKANRSRLEDIYQLLLNEPAFANQLKSLL
jgi:hypothetical protein